MSKTFSIYLDLIRFLAALGVFISHVSSYPFTVGIFWNWVNSYGDICVIIFFVLSGYVIAFVISTRENSVKKYFISRFSRLYSVTLIALILTYALDISGMSINPDFYLIQKVLWRPESWTGYISSLFFVNEFQVFQFGGIAPGTNGPYWSLSFEVTYYIVAGFFIFTPLRIALPVAVILLWLAGRTIAALMPVWIFGYVLYHVRDRIRFSNWIATVCFFTAALFLALIPTIWHWLPTDNFGFKFPWGRGPFNRSLIVDYLTALAFGLHLIAAKQLTNSSAEFTKHIERPIRWLGATTFPLYLLHYPALCFLRAISPWPPYSKLNLMFIVVGVLLLVSLLTPLCDSLKIIFRNRLKVIL